MEKDIEVVEYGTTVLLKDKISGQIVHVEEAFSYRDIQVNDRIYIESILNQIKDKWILSKS